MTLEMIPRFATCRCRQGRLRHAVVACKSGQIATTRVIHTPDIEHVASGQFSQPIFLAAVHQFRLLVGPVRVSPLKAQGVNMRPMPISRRSAALHRHISGVLGVCTEEQVRWPHASFHVTRMADAQPIGDWAVRQLPRCAMGRNGSVHWPTADTEMPVPVSHHGRGPQPAFPTLVNMAPEPLSDWKRLLSHLCHVINYTVLGDIL